MDYGAPTKGAFAEGVDNASLSVDYPAHSPGDLLALFSAVKGNAPVETPNGWTLVSSLVNGITMRLWIREARNNEPATIALSPAGSGGDKWMAQMAAFPTGMHTYQVPVDITVDPPGVETQDIPTLAVPASSGYGGSRLVIYLGTKDANVAPFDTMPNGSTLIEAKNSTVGNDFTAVWSYLTTSSGALGSSAFDSSTSSTATERSKIIALREAVFAAVGAGRSRRRMVEINGHVFDADLDRFEYVSKTEQAPVPSEFRPVETRTLPRSYVSSPIASPRTELLNTSTGLRRLARKS
jgi:hypothetical protein